MTKKFYMQSENSAWKRERMDDEKDQCYGKILLHKLTSKQICCGFLPSKRFYSSHTKITLHSIVCKNSNEMLYVIVSNLKHQKQKS